MLDSWAVQVAVVTRLKAHAGLAAIVGARVFDHVPEGAVYPYVEIDDDSVTDDGTKDRDGAEHTVQVQLWSRHRGRREVKLMAAAVSDALHRQTLILSGGSHAVNCRREFAETFRDDDGLTYRGVLRFRIVTAANQPFLED